MASSKLMTSSNSRNSDPPSSKPQFTTTNFLDDSQISLADPTPKTVDDVWREIISGERRECKEEAIDEMMTLEDFLVKAGAVDDEDDADEIKMPIPLTDTLSGGSSMFAVDPSFQRMESMEGFGNGMEVVEGGGGGSGRGKRGRPVLDQQLDKAAQQRQRRMIKNRESAARSRERKQAYQVELESLAVKLEEENDKLTKESAERTKERFKQVLVCANVSFVLDHLLMENVIPVVEKRRPPRLLRRIRSGQW